MKKAGFKSQFWPKILANLNNFLKMLAIFLAIYTPHR